MLSIHERVGEILRGVRRTVCQAELAIRRTMSSNSVFPTDEPRGVVDGPFPDRVVVLGDWNTVGMGIATYDLSLPASFARALANRTERGVNWSIAPVDGFQLRAVPAAVTAVAAQFTDAQVVILQLGALESMQFVAPRQWHDDLVAAIEAILAAVGESGCVVLAAIPPMDVIGTLTKLSAREIGRECRALDAVSRAVVEEYPRCLFSEFPEGLASEVWIAEANDFHFSHSYAVWGASIARQLALASEGAHSYSQ